MLYFRQYPQRQYKAILGGILSKGIIYTSNTFKGHTRACMSVYGRVKRQSLKMYRCIIRNSYSGYISVSSIGASTNSETFFPKMSSRLYILKISERKSCTCWQNLMNPKERTFFYIFMPLSVSSQRKDLFYISVGSVGASQTDTEEPKQEKPLHSFSTVSK